MRFPALAVRSPNLIGILAVAVLAALLPGRATAADEAAMITAIEGGVERVTAQGPAAVQAFVKLRRGDQLKLAKAARVQIVYFESARQETWRGDGRLEIGDDASRPTGLAGPDVRTLPEVMVRQIARTPALDGQSRAGVVRLRALAPPNALGKLEASYREMRADADAADLTPDWYLLSGLFELKEFERLEQALSDLRKTRPANAEVEQAAAVYRKAIAAPR